MQEIEDMSSDRIQAKIDDISAQIISALGDDSLQRQEQIELIQDLRSIRLDCRQELEFRAEQAKLYEEQEIG